MRNIGTQGLGRVSQLKMGLKEFVPAIEQTSLYIKKRRIYSFAVYMMCFVSEECVKGYIFTVILKLFLCRQQNYPPPGLRTIKKQKKSCRPSTPWLLDTRNA